MSEFGFATGNSTIDGRIVHSYSYDNNNQTYSVTCDVQFRRNNTSTGYETQGVINYELYLYYGDSSSSKTGSKSFLIPNNAGVPLNERWKSLLTYTFMDISLERFATSSYKVGFKSSRNSGGPSAFNIPLKTSTSYTVGPYSTQVGAPQNLTISSDGNNFKISCKVGKNGTNNDSQGVKIYYTTDGTDPNVSTPTHQVIRKSAGSNVSTSNIHITWDTNVKARAYTIPEYENDKAAVFTYTDVVDRIVEYSPDFKWGTEEFNLSCVNNKRPTPRESYEVKMPTLTGPDGLVYKKRIVIKNQKEKENVLYDDTILGDITSITLPKNYFKDSLQPDDEITAYLTPMVYKGTSYKSGDSISSNTLTILTPSNVKININGGTSWVDGQPYVYDNGWKESTGVFIHNGEGWKESI